MSTGGNGHIEDVRTLAAGRLTLLRYALVLCVIASVAAAWFGAARVSSVHGLATRLAPLPILAALIPLALFAVASWRTGTMRMVKGLWITALLTAPILVGVGIHRMDWNPRYRLEAYLVATLTALIAAAGVGVIRAWPVRRRPMPVAIVSADNR